MMNKVLGFLFCAVLLCSCSDKNYEDLEEEEKQEIIPIDTLTLLVDTQQGNIYDPFIFKLHDGSYARPNTDVALFLKYSDLLDSLVWSVEGAPGRFKLSDKKEGYFNSQWSHYFYLPGDYTAFLHGYKGDELIMADTLYVSVANDKDFLNLNWQEIVETGHNMVYNSHGLYDYSFAVLSLKKDGITAVRMFARLDNSMLANSAAGKERHREELFNYMSQLYGNPTFSEDTQTTLRQVFQDRFKVQLGKDTEVLSVWETEKSNISLLKTFDQSHDDYEIYAEPADQ